MNLSYFCIILYLVFIIIRYFFILIECKLWRTMKKIFCITLLLIFSFFNNQNLHAFSQEDLEKLLKTNECIQCDLSKANFKKANLSNANLQGSNLNGANLWRANLSNANLENCSLEQANLKRVNFSNANLNRARFHWSIIRYAIMDGATAYQADFSKTKIKKTNLKLVKFCETKMPYGIDNSSCDK